MPSFYNGKRFFLTFPRVDKTTHELVAYLQDQAPVKSYVVCRELHEDGFPHLHACVEFETTQRHGVRWLDSFGTHPNKQDPRNWAACCQYVKKGGDFIEGPEEASVAEDTLEEFLNKCESENEWMVYCQRKKISFQYAQWFWQRNKADLSTLIDDDCEGTICDQLKDLQYTSVYGKAWVIKGPSGCGKTTWAKKNIPKPALFVSHIDALKQFRPGFHKGIIFDDVDFNHYPRTSQIHLVDWDNPRQVHCRHAVAFIPHGIHKVFTCNEWPISKHDEAIARRCKFFTIK